MKHQTNDTRQAKLKGTDRIVTVYKLKEKQPGTGKTRWHIFLGESLTMASVEAGAHNEEWTEDQIELL